MKPNAIERIMQRAVRDSSGCLICNYLPCNAYPMVRWFNEATGKWSMRQASILVYEHNHGPMEPGQVVMHRCDNPRCVDIEHLSAGTQRQNVHDSISKRRWSMNDRHKWSRLSVEEVKAIRASDLSGKELASRYGVSYRHIRYIVTGAERKYAS